MVNMIKWFLAHKKLFFVGEEQKNCDKTNIEIDTHNLKSIFLFFRQVNNVDLRIQVYRKHLFVPLFIEQFTKFIVIKKVTYPTNFYYISCYLYYNKINNTCEIININRYLI